MRLTRAEHLPAWRVSVLTKIELDDCDLGPNQI